MDQVFLLQIHTHRDRLSVKSLFLIERQHYVYIIFLQINVNYENAIKIKLKLISDFGFVIYV